MADLNRTKLKIPAKVSDVIGALKQEGYEAYAVGGCIRDSLLGRIPMDWDITTSALPEQVKKVFDHTVDTGIAHGTVTVIYKGETFEVTTFRVDGEYTDNRHPRSVIFTPSLQEDLKRRDFTINAMAYAEPGGLIDLYGGVVDLHQRIIRCVGNPKERFGEDALRIMRAVRFAAQLDFAIDEKTALAAKELAPTLGKISAERVRDELVKLLISDHPQRMWTLMMLGITKEVLPEFDEVYDQPQNGKHHNETVGAHTLLSLEKIRADKVLRLTMLLHDLGKKDTAVCGEDGIWHFPGHAEKSAETARKILRRLRFDNETIRRVTTLVQVHSFYPEPTQEGVRRAVARIGPDLFDDFLLVKRADIAAQIPETPNIRLETIDRIEQMYEQILLRGDCLDLSSLALTGKDLIEDGMEKGPKIGEVLNGLLDMVLTDPSLNEREILLEKSRELRR